MYKLLIVDDESIERDALKYIVKESNLKIGEIEEASNGQEAISVATIFNPDIVILDIKMPGLNGIEAAKILKKIYSDSKIIFLTAFNQFEYAHEAIKIGVEDFIVKPASKERVIEVLSKTIEEIEKHEKANLNKKDMEEKLSQVSKYLESEFLTSVISGEIDEQQASDYLSFMLTEFNQGFGIAIKLDFFNEHMTHINKNMIKKRFSEKLLNSLRIKNIKFLMNTIRNTIYIMIFGYPEGNKEVYVQLIEAEIKKIREVMSDQINACVSIGCGNEYDSISELWKSFSQAKIACKNRVLMIEEDVHVPKVNSLDIKEKELCESIIEGNIREMILIVEDILDNIIYSSNDISDIRIKLYEFLILLNKSLNSDRNFQNRVPEKLFDDLKTVYSKGEAKVFIHEYLLNVIEEINQMKTDKTGLILNKVVKYIDDHYADNLTLEDVAQQCGFSTYYFCKMFKKYQNCSFTDYLSSVRIKKAKKLLKNPLLNIKEITQMIGYVDPNYFTRVFKKYEGITPTEYRNKMMMN